MTGRWLELPPADLSAYLAVRVRREWTPCLERLLRLAADPGRGGGDGDAC